MAGPERNVDHPNAPAHPTRWPHRTPPSPLTAAADDELLELLRRGDQRAAEILRSRHADAGLELARTLCGPGPEARDALTEGFARVLADLLAGRVDLPFRPHLLRAVRRASVGRAGTGGDQPDGHPPVGGDGGGSVGLAFADLTGDERALLWHADVEGDRPARTASVVGLDRDDLTAAVARSRAALRRTFVRRHLRSETDEACRAVACEVESYFDGTLPGRRERTIEAHVAGCERCHRLYADVGDLRRGLRRTLATELLGPDVALRWLAASRSSRVDGSRRSTGPLTTAIVIAVAMLGAAGGWGPTPERTRPPAPEEMAAGARADRPTVVEDALGPGEDRGGTAGVTGPGGTAGVTGPGGNAGVINSPGGTAGVNSPAGTAGDLDPLGSPPTPTPGPSPDPPAAGSRAEAATGVPPGPPGSDAVSGSPATETASSSGRAPAPDPPIAPVAPDSQAPAPSPPAPSPAPQPSTGGSPALAVSVAAAGPVVAGRTGQVAVTVTNLEPTAAEEVTVTLELGATVSLSELEAPRSEKPGEEIAEAGCRPSTPGRTECRWPVLAPEEVVRRTLTVHFANEYVPGPGAELAVTVSASIGGSPATLTAADSDAEIPLREGGMAGRFSGRLAGDVAVAGAPLAACPAAGCAMPERAWGPAATLNLPDGADVIAAWAVWSTAARLEQPVLRLALPGAGAAVEVVAESTDRRGDRVQYSADVRSIVAAAGAGPYRAAVDASPVTPLDGGWVLVVVHQRSGAPERDIIVLEGLVDVAGELTAELAEELPLGPEARGEGSVSVVHLGATDPAVRAGLEIAGTAVLLEPPDGYRESVTSPFDVRSAQLPAGALAEGGRRDAVVVGRGAGDTVGLLALSVDTSADAPPEPDDEPDGEPDDRDAGDTDDPAVGDKLADLRPPASPAEPV